MQSKTQQVKRFFDNTDIYLAKDFGVSLRALAVRNLLGELRSSAILDLGCGDGRVSLQYQSGSNNLTLVDLSDRMLNRAKANTAEVHSKNVQYVRRDFLELDCEQSFDVVLCLGVLAHVESVEKVLAKVATFVKSGGRCIFQITDNRRFIARIESMCRPKRVGPRSYGYSINKPDLLETVRLAQSNGLELIRDQRYSLLLPGMGRLPNKWLFTYQRTTLENRVLSRHGSEVILLFSKK